VNTPGLLESPGGALAVAFVAHGLLMLLPVQREERRQPLEYVDFELAAEEVADPEPEPEPEPPPPEPEAPAGELVEEPDRDPTKTSLSSNREDADTPDEEVPIVTGIALTADQVVDDGMAVRVGNTDAAGFDAPDVDPTTLEGFAGQGRGGGGEGAGVKLDRRATVARAFDPIYPRDLLKQDIEGRVVVQVEVLANGRVGRVVPVHSDHPLFFASVKKALRRYRFKPAVYQGEKLTTSITLRFRFKLDEHK